MADRFDEYQGHNVISLNRRIGSEGAPPGPPLPPSGGGGTFDGMEPRVAVLENDIRHIKDDIQEAKETLKSLQSDTTTLRTDVATLKENVRHLPSKGFIVTAVSALLTLVAAFIVFQGNIQRAVGIAAHTSAPSAAPVPPAAGAGRSFHE